MIKTIISTSFSQLVKELDINFKEKFLNKPTLFLADVDNKKLWEIYLNSHLDLKERQHSNCNTCKNFFYHYGNLVTIENYKVVSIWRYVTDEPKYKYILDQLANYVEKAEIKSLFYTDQPKMLGTDKISLGVWCHFNLILSKHKKGHNFFNNDTAFKINESIDTFNVFKKAVTTFSKDSLETTLELIAQNVLERGLEFKHIISNLLAIKKHYEFLSKDKQDNYLWSLLNTDNTNYKVYNSAIGTFLKDLNKNVDLEEAIIKFGKVMNPYNYKRPKNVYTASQIKETTKTLDKLGLTNSLKRRLAICSDISINNVIWANRNTNTLESKTDNNTMLDVMLSEVSTYNPYQFKNAVEISLDKFLVDIVPTSQSIELLFENKHKDNLVSLIAPQDLDSPSLTNWDNGFTWTYNNNLADSIKEKVKLAGGQIEGFFRTSLAWYNTDDLDLSIVEPNDHVIYYRVKTSNTKGFLDVDCNVRGESTTPVENIIYPFDHKMKDGIYSIYITQFTKRNNINYNFDIQLDLNGDIYLFSYNKILQDKAKLKIIDVEYISTTNELKLVKSYLEESKSSQKIWNLNTNNFQKVSMILNSPNHWENAMGNKHLFFMLENCQNDNAIIRGFFNEQLSNSLLKHKRVFEALGERITVDTNVPNQLSGLGFSTSKKGELIFKVTNKTQRLFKVQLN